MPIILFLLFFSFSLFAQENELHNQQLEYWLEKNGSEAEDLTNLMENWNYFKIHPINLNKTNIEELRSLQLISEIQIAELFLHLKKNGSLISMYELQSLNYWDIHVIDIISPFVEVRPKEDLVALTTENLWKDGKIEFISRYQRGLPQSTAYSSVPDSIKKESNLYYQGDPNKYYTRFRYSYQQKISIALTTEKDAGEQFTIDSKTKGFDFYSFHLFYKGKGLVRTFAVGDYQLQIGQGLNFWTSFAFGKSSEAQMIKKNAFAIRPHTSSDESRFLRGGAVELCLKNWSLVTFSSYKNIDVSISTEASNILAMYNSGLHRTTSEIERKEGGKETIIGANLKYDKNTFHAGIASVYTSFSLPYERELKLYNNYYFRGKSNVSSSMDYSYTWRNVLVFGEFSIVNYSMKTALLQGLSIALDNKLSVSVLYRKYDKAYETFYNAGFSEGNSTQNETGLYTGITYSPFKKVTFQGYVDVFKFPWLKFQVDAPSYGSELLSQLTFKLNKKSEVYFRYRIQNKEVNSKESTAGIKKLELNQQNNYRFHFSYTIAENYQFKTRLEWVGLKQEGTFKENGVLFFQDFIYKSPLSKIDFTFRYAQFQTDSYASRLYAYESNLLYVYSNASLYGTGNRYYLMTHFKVNTKIECWIRFSSSFYPTQKTIGTGTDEILGNVKNEIGAELRWVF
jgi:hypothetical protein